MNHHCNHTVSCRWIETLLDSQRHELTLNGKTCSYLSITVKINAACFSVLSIYLDSKPLAISYNLLHIQPAHADMF